MAAEQITKNGVVYQHITSGDAADASWERTCIESLGFPTAIREVDEDDFWIYIPADQVAAYRKARNAQEAEYWRREEGIEKQKMLGCMMRPFTRSPEGRLQKHLDKLEQQGRFPEHYYMESGFWKKPED